LVYVNFASNLRIASSRPVWVTVSGAGQTAMSAATRAAMSRKLVWVEQPGLRCWGCSECAWVFNPSGAPKGKTFDESVRNFELQRDKEFTLHVCADQPRAKNEGTKHEVKQDWERLYRAAIIEPDRSKVLQRVEVAEAAILERSRSLSSSPANSGKEQEAITKALHILSLLRAKAGD
jgi:hypothetical protein